MNLNEHEGRAYFEQYNIPVPKGFIATDSNNALLEAQKLADNNPDIEEFVLKAQILGGKRGKHGGIVFSDLGNLKEKFDSLKSKLVDGQTFDEILVVEKLGIAQELYLSIVVDRFERKPVIIFSEDGGIDIEDIAAQSPEKIRETVIDDGHSFPENEFRKSLEGPGYGGEVVEQIVSIAKKLLEFLISEDAILAEVNPLILDDKKLLFAADSKIVIDNNSISRHEDLAKHEFREMSELEKKAKENDLAYVELEGDIAIIGNGAGLVMATLDVIDNFGGTPANFCDVGGGASMEMMGAALDIVMQKPSVRGLFINIFGGITHCDEIAKGIVEYLKGHELKKPMVVRMVGTNEEEANRILKTEGIITLSSFDEAAKKIISLIK